MPDDVPRDVVGGGLAGGAGPDPVEVLRRVFGFPEFRGLQEAAVRRVLAGSDALVLMPTGGGKSICYQLPALCRQGTAIVVSPLIALMEDQVAGLRQLGVAAAALHSELDQDDAWRVGRELDAGRLDLVYVSPERLLMEGTLERLRRIEVALIAIDEAHCVSQWGHEFRPEYRDLARLARSFPGVPRIALTATADPRTRADLIRALDMPEAEVFAASFHRPNLFASAAPKIGETQQLLDFLKRHRNQAGIVYCGSRAKTERVALKLKEKGATAMSFHAGMSPLEKRDVLARFRSGEAVVVVATIAFGMGIDRPDVRFVVHLDMPDSPEAYYQQIGRAGRDGDLSRTLLLYGAEDIARARHWQSQSAAPEAQKRIARDRLESMIGLTETASCRTRALLRCFGEELGRDCGHCDNCVSPPRLFDGTVDAQKVLSAVYRTGQMFGALHIVSVLRGKATDAVRKHHHDELKLFGIGRDKPEGFWRGVLRQLVTLGALRVDQGEYATLSLDEGAARPILRGEHPIMLREDELARDRAVEREERVARGEAAQAYAGPVPEGVFEALRSWRAGEARSQGLPPYVIFHDSVLRDIAAVRPGTLEELGQIKGVGTSKLDRYGAAVLEVLARS